MSLKKVFMILLAFAMVFTMAGAVSADDTESEDIILHDWSSASEDVPVTLEFKSDDMFIVTIPSAFVIHDNDGDGTYESDEQRLSIDAVTLELESQYLTITVDSMNEFYLKSGNTDISYDLKYANSNNPNDVDSGEIITSGTSELIEILTGTPDEGIELPKYIMMKAVVTGNTDKLLTGTYEDSLTFSASITAYMCQINDNCVFYNGHEDYNGEGASDGCLYTDTVNEGECSKNPSTCVLGAEHLGECIGTLADYIMCQKGSSCVFHNGHEGDCVEGTDHSSGSQCSVDGSCVLAESHEDCCRDFFGSYIPCSKNLDDDGSTWCAFYSNHEGECVESEYTYGECVDCALEIDHEGSHRDYFGKEIQV